MAGGTRQLFPRKRELRAGLQCRSHRTPVREAAGVVAPEGAVFEHAPAFGAVTGGAGDVVDDAEGGAGDDVGVVEVVDLAFGPVLAAPLAVCPVGVAAVAGAD